jgi:hypothetical protein
MKMMKRRKRMPMTEKMPSHPLLPRHHLLCPPDAALEDIDKEGPMEAIPEQEVPMSHEVVLADAELKMSQLHLYHALMRDYEEDPLRMDDDFDDLDDDPNEGHSDMDEWFPDDGSNGRD